MGRTLQILGLMMIPVALFAGVAAVALLVSGALGWVRERKQRRERRELAEKNLLLPWPRLKARMRRLARPTLLLVPTKEPGFSKIGGDPELPDGAAWPAGVKGPRVFVAQIDLAAFQPHARIEWLPMQGGLYVFFDDERNGFADLAQVIYSDAPPGPPRPPPQPPAKRWRFGERRVGFLPLMSVPSLDWLDVDLETLDEDTLDRAVELPAEPFGDEIQHRIGGYPGEIQNGQLAIECEYIRRGLTPDDAQAPPDHIRRAARQWRLLLQVDSDEALGINWWDGGRLYVFVREQDARAGDFSQTVTLGQSH